MTTLPLLNFCYRALNSAVKNSEEAFTNANETGDLVAFLGSAYSEKS